MDFLLVTVLSFGIFVGYNAQQSENLNFACRNEEEYDMCRSPCEPTCETSRSGIRRNCTRPCVAGCFCREGLLRARDRSCILPEECGTRTRPACKENEEFQECGSPCVANCSNLNDPIFCTKPCHSGCFCKQDFVRDSKGNCVHQKSCYTAGHKQCPMNEHYVDCINFCNTCWENSECRSHYCTPGCDCKSGFYRNYYGQWVTAEECLNPYYDSSYPNFRGYCGENEIYTDCVIMCNDCIYKGRCNFEYYCEPGCDCKPGYFRNERGVCVPEQFCFRKRPICPPDEQYYSCIPTCRATCDTYSDSRVICDTSCTPGCFCKSGLIRTKDGKCVSPRNCPARNPTCPPREVFYQCLPTCRTTCETLNTTNRGCPIECRPGCFCQPGFVRNSNGRCVNPGDCEEFSTSGNFPFDARRGGTDDDDMTDPTTSTTGEDTTGSTTRPPSADITSLTTKPTTEDINSSTTSSSSEDITSPTTQPPSENTSDLTTSPTTEVNQVTDKPTQKDSQSPSSSIPVTTMPPASVVTNHASAATRPVTPATTELSSGTVVPVTPGTDLPSTSANPLTSITNFNLDSTVTNIMTTSKTNAREDPTVSDSLTLEQSSTGSSRNTKAVETSSNTNVLQMTKINTDEIMTLKTTDTTPTENVTTFTTTQQ